MTRIPTTRRQFLQLAAGTGLASRVALAAARPAGSTPSSVAADGAARAAISDESLRLEFDSAMRSRAWHLRPDAPHTQLALSAWSGTDYLVLTGGARLVEFALEHEDRAPVRGPEGEGERLTLTGRSASAIEKTVRIEMWRRYPGFAFCRVSYRNLSARPLALRGWYSAHLTLLPMGDSRAAAPGDWRSSAAPRDGTGTPMRRNRRRSRRP